MNESVPLLASNSSGNILPPEGRTTSRVLLLALGLTALAITIVLKLITADRPIARDVMLYTVIGHEMFEGRALYTDLFEHKPPLFLAIFGMANQVFGYGHPGILALGIACAVASLIGTYLACRLMGGTPMTGMFGALAWAWLSNDVNMHAHQPMPECFINACLIWSFALFLSLHSRSLQVGKCLLIGLCLMMASQVKQPVVIVALGWAFVHMISRQENAEDRWRRFGQLLIIGSVGAASWFGMFAYYGLTGRYQVFYDSIFAYNRHYAGLPENSGLVYGLKVIWWNFSSGLRAHRMFPGFLWMTAPLLIASLAALVPGLRHGDRRHWMLWLSYLTTTFLVVTLPGRGYNHYYIIYLPVFITGAAGLAVLLRRWLGERRGARISCPLAVVALLVLGGAVIHQLTSPTTVWARIGYGAMYETVERLSHRIDEALLPDETLYVWDYQPAFYVLPHRRPPAGVFYHEHASSGPVAKMLTDRVLDMMHRQPAEVYIVGDHRLKDMEDLSKAVHPVEDWIRRHARRVDWSDAAPYLIYVRTGGPLDQRIRTGAVRWRYTTP